MASAISSGSWLPSRMPRPFDSMSGATPVGVPTTGLADDLAFHATPIKALLADVMQRGAAVHVCPHCMAALDVEEADLVIRIERSAQRQVGCHAPMSCQAWFHIAIFVFERSGGFIGAFLGDDT